MGASAVAANGGAGSHSFRSGTAAGDGVAASHGFFDSPVLSPVSGGGSQQHQQMLQQQQSQQAQQQQQSKAQGSFNFPSNLSSPSNSMANPGNAGTRRGSGSSTAGGGPCNSDIALVVGPWSGQVAVTDAQRSGLLQAAQQNGARAQQQVAMAHGLGAHGGVTAAGGARDSDGPKTWGFLGSAENGSGGVAARTNSNLSAADSAALRLTSTTSSGLRCSSSRVGVAAGRELTACPCHPWLAQAMLEVVCPMRLRPCCLALGAWQ